MAVTTGEFVILPISMKDALKMVPVSNFLKHSQTELRSSWVPQLSEMNVGTAIGAPEVYVAQNVLADD